MSAETKDLAAGLAAKRTFAERMSSGFPGMSVRDVLLDLALGTASQDENHGYLQGLSNEQLAFVVSKHAKPCMEWFRTEYDRFHDEYETMHASVVQMKRDIARLEKDVADYTGERDSLIEQLRALQKEVDPDEIKLRIMYATDEACAEKNKALAESKARIAEQQSEIEELKRSKKRLREALDRLAKNT